MRSLGCCCVRPNPILFALSAFKGKPESLADPATLAVEGGAKPKKWS